MICPSTLTANKTSKTNPIANTANKKVTPNVSVKNPSIISFIYLLILLVIELV